MLISRQFVDLKSDELHEMFSRFPQLAQTGTQNTTVEDDTVRFIYEPLEELYVVLLTDKSSNIIQDMKTLRLLSQLVSTNLDDSQENSVIESAFKIICAFDEVINLGYSENLTLAQVETFLEMESYEEVIEDIIVRNKELEAAEERKKKAKQLEMQRKAARQMSGDTQDYSSAAAAAMLKVQMPKFESQSAQSLAAPHYYAESAASHSRLGGGSAPQSHAPKGKGLQLGKKRSAVPEDVPLLAKPERDVGAPARRQGLASRPAVPQSENVEISVVEQLTVEVNRDGTVSSSRVSGALHMFAGDRSNARLKIQTAISGPANAYKTNPKMDRALFSKSHTLKLKNAAEEFPASNVLLVKWVVDEVHVPITINSWISESQDPGFMNVTLEYEVAPDFEGKLQHVEVEVPLATPNAHVLDPDAVFEQFDERIVWVIPEASSAEGQSSGSFEFSAEADGEDDFYPMHIRFSANSVPSTLGKIDIQEVANAESGDAVVYNKAFEFKTESYVIR